jgi:hypothetical protein
MNTNDNIVAPLLTPALPPAETAAVPSWAYGLLTTTEVCADLSGVPLGTVEDLVQQGLVRVEFIRGSWHVAVCDVIRAAAAGEAGA